MPLCGRPHDAAPSIAARASTRELTEYANTLNARPPPRRRRVAARAGPRAGRRLAEAAAKAAVEIRKIGEAGRQGDLHDLLMAGARIVEPPPGEGEAALEQELGEGRARLLQDGAQIALGNAELTRDRGGRRVRRLRAGVDLGDDRPPPSG